MTKVVHFLEQDLVFKEKSKDPRFQDLSELKYGRLTVLGYAGKSKSKHHLWFCKCECGNVRMFQATNFKKGHTLSCGCFQTEKATIHGHASGYKSSPTYSSWQSMLARCRNPKCKEYPEYGGRGIKVCDRWLESFENFLADMGKRPEGTSLDRYPDNDKGYYPENCRWATRKEQQNNTRANVFLTYDGKTQNITQWADEFGITGGVLRSRLRNGWPIKKALMQPVKHKLRLQ